MCMLVDMCFKRGRLSAVKHAPPHEIVEFHRTTRVSRGDRADTHDTTARYTTQQTADSTQSLTRGDEGQHSRTQRTLTRTLTRQREGRFFSRSCARLESYILSVPCPVLARAGVGSPCTVLRAPWSWPVEGPALRRAGRREHVTRPGVLASYRLRWHGAGRPPRRALGGACRLRVRRARVSTAISVYSSHANRAILFRHLPERTSTDRARPLAKPGQIDLNARPQDRGRATSHPRTSRRSRGPRSLARNPTRSRKAGACSSSRARSHPTLIRADLEDLAVLARSRPPQPIPVRRPRAARLAHAVTPHSLAHPRRHGNASLDAGCHAGCIMLHGCSASCARAGSFSHEPHGVRPPRMSPSSARTMRRPSQH